MSKQPDSAFWELMRASAGEDAVHSFREALQTPPPVSVRLNPFKTPAAGKPFPEGERVPWSAEGRYIGERPAFTLDPLLHAGAYYVQDASAMAVGEVLRRCLEPSAGTPVRVLDACAAPGGKTTDAAASLRGSYGDGFLLVSNEVMRQRASVLKDNVAIWGDPCVAVTSADPAAFGAMGGFFDLVIADVPCSGEGMFRKDEGAVRDWLEAAVSICAARARRIVSALWPALRQGGILIFSTCTFNHFENGDNVRWIASELGADIVTPQIDAPGAIPADGGYLFVPGMVRGEGQFVAALRKTAPGSRVSSFRTKGGGATLPDGLLDRPCTLRLRGDTVIALPEAIAADAAALDSLHPLSVGTAAGRFKGRDFIPSADLALSLLLAPDAFPSVSLDREKALAFLHRDTLVLPGAPKGFVRVDYDGLPLGFVKNLGQRCNNLHPADRRIRMDIV